MYKIIVVLLLLICLSCKQITSKKSFKKEVFDSFKIFTKKSTLPNEYINFNSSKAINKVAEMENEYFNSYTFKTSKYYGTQWYSSIGQTIAKNDSVSIFKKYSLEKKEQKLDSMHCTIYAIEALKAGFEKEFEILKKEHINIWSNREYAGWSIAYLLTKFYHWKAYLFISKDSDEYKICLNNYKKDKKYHVWKQPDIPLKGVFDVDTDQEKITILLKNNEFGWGFSNQGWHTWITRFDYLKECNWLGAPAKKYDSPNNKPLFIKTKFTNYYDYNSHIIVFPPKRKKL